MMSLSAQDILQDFPVHSIIIDANILVLLVVGGVNPERLSKHKRTRSLGVSPDELQLINEVVRRFRTVRTTPTILAETNNLLGDSADDRAMLAELVHSWIEVYEPSRQVIEQYEAEYLRMGLADAAIVHLAVQGHTVVTDDAVLYNDLCSRGLDAINLAHLRSF